MSLYHCCTNFRPYLILACQMNTFSKKFNKLLEFVSRFIWVGLENNLGCDIKASTHERFFTSYNECESNGRVKVSTRDRTCCTCEERDSQAMRHGYCYQPCTSHLHWQHACKIPAIPHFRLCTTLVCAHLNSCWLQCFVCVRTQIGCADGSVMNLCNLIFICHPFQTSPIFCHPIYPLPTSPIVHDRFITHSLSFIHFKHPHSFSIVCYNLCYYPKQET